MRPIEAIENRDWDRAWQDAQAASTYKPKDKAFWNRRAVSFAANANHKSDYPQQFLNILRPGPHWRVLDVGCGPGTIAVPMSKKVKHITALDFSDRMLVILKEQCTEKNIGNITPVLADWQDDWQAIGIKPHDLVVASRSFMPASLTATIIKLNRYATQQVCISAPVGTGPFDRRIMAAAGRPFQPGPDYIFILNQLHRMGIYASLDFTIHPVVRTYADERDALQECRWMVPDMTPDEENRLLQFFQHNLVGKRNHRYLPDTSPVRWAVISWVPAPDGEKIEKEI